MRAALIVLCLVVAAANADPPTLTGPAPRSEILSVEEPTPATIARDLGGWYAMPELHKVVPIRDGAITRWTRSYDGIEMELAPVTSRLGGQWITRFQPELAGPARPKRDKLIKEAAAVQAAKRPQPKGVKLIYRAVLGVRRLAGTTSSNAMDFIQVVESWQLVYRIADAPGGSDVDAYSGKVVQTWSNVVN